MITYLASPYSHKDLAARVDRFNQVCKAAGKLMLAGRVVYSPIAHNHPIALQQELPTSWEFWKTFDEEMLKVCGELVVLQLSGWNENIGVRAEIEIARSIGMPVLFMEPI